MVENLKVIGTSLVNNNEHFCLKVTPKIREIVKPLFDNTEITYFCYGRRFQDNTGFSLHSDEALFKTWFQKRFEEGESDFEDGIYVWSHTLSNEEMNENKTHGVGNGIVIFNTVQDGREMFIFAGNPENEKIVVDFCFNNLDLINRFKLYFKDKGKQLIEEAKDNKLVFPNPIKPQQETKPFKPSFNLEEQFPINRYYLDKDSSSLCFSPREFQCFKGFLKGETSREISEKMDISHKTVESYLRNVKKQFRCRTRSELLARCWALGILKMGSAL